MGARVQPKKFDRFWLLLKDDTVIAFELKEAFYKAVGDSIRSRAGDATRISVVVEVSR